MQKELGQLCRNHIMVRHRSSQSMNYVTCKKWNQEVVT